MKVKAILFDSRSIQKYIFAGNRMKTNIGASYLVEHLFDTLLVKTLEETGALKDRLDVESWKTKTKDFSLCDEVGQLGFVGGGNALVLLRSAVLGDEGAASLAKDIVSRFSRKVLVECPGLHIGVAIGDLDLENYKESRRELAEEQKRVQQTAFPAVSIPYTGLTHLCDIDGQVANAYDSGLMSDGDGEQRYYSQEAVAKVMAAKKANQALSELFSDIFAGTSFYFPMELDELGVEKGMNYISIVHVDGNNMGEKFKDCNTLAEYCAMSAAVKQKTRNAFGRLLESIIAEYESYTNKNEAGKSLLNLKKNALPIRPLILGGDDVTFVCPAKMALAYTTRFITFMEEIDNSIGEPEARSIDCCGGITILKTSYPFFRGYQLAEQLCDSAKNEMRKVGSSSWIDFILLHGEQAPTLRQIMRTEYKDLQGQLHFGPYRVNNANGKYKRKNIENLVLCAKKLGAKRSSNKDNHMMSRSRAKELRRVLQLDASAVDSFLMQLEHVEQHKLEGIPGWEVFEKHLFNVDADPKNRETPYVDAIEMADFVEGFGAEA